MCNFWGVKGHKEYQCFKKNPNKTHHWWKEKNVQAELVLSRVEVMLTSLGKPAKERVNVTALQAEKGQYCGKKMYVCVTQEPECA